MKKQKTVEHGKYGVMFIVPFFLVFFVFQLYPLIYTFYNSLLYTEKNGKTFKDAVFGFGNFSNYVFGERGGGEIWKALAITAVLWVLNFIPQILLSLLLAAWFTDVRYKLKGTGAFKVIMYMPNIITAATIGFLFYGLFYKDGPITTLLRDIGLSKSETGILSKGWAALVIVAFIQFWMWYGNTMIVLCAGILGINPALYEAAMVDGANSKQQFFKITLPLLKPILQYTLVTSAIGGLQMFDIPQLFNDGGPAVFMSNGSSVDSTTTVMMLIKKYSTEGNGKYELGRAAAYSVILFIVTMLVSLIFYKATQEKSKDGR